MKLEKKSGGFFVVEISASPTVSEPGKSHPRVCHHLSDQSLDIPYLAEAKAGLLRGMMGGLKQFPDKKAIYCLGGNMALGGGMYTLVPYRFSACDVENSTSQNDSVGVRSCNGMI